jgi:hypothetical protein
MKIRSVAFLAFVSFGLVFSAHAEVSGKRVFFKNLKDGQQVTSPLNIELGVEGMGVEKAGELKEGTGHHHLIIDGDSVPKGEVVLKDEKHLHYGNGQTEISVPLPPGKHKLTLQFADGAHRSYGPEYSSTVEVEVKG